MSEPDPLAVEVDVLAARAGITIPDDRRQTILDGYAELKRLAALLRTTDLTAADEPATVYSFANITRSA